MEVQRDIQAQEQEPKDWPKVAIIILNWNGWRDTVECLESVQKLTYPNYRVIVIDNSSTDDSVERIKAWARGEVSVESKFFKYDSPNKFVEWIEYDWATAEAAGILKEEGKIEQISPNRKMTIIKNGRNLGFAGGNNVGILYALQTEAQYIWLLNNDTVVHSDSLKHLVQVAEQDSHIGLLSPKIYYYDHPLMLWYGGGSLDYIRLWPRHWWVNCYNISLNGVKDVTFVNGAAMFLKRQCVQDIGLLDEKFFLRMEDAEYSYRAIRKGWSLKVCYDAVIWHKVGRSAGKEDKPIIWYYDTRNRLYFGIKYLPLRRSIIFLAFFVFSRFLNFLRLPLTLRTAHLKASMHGIVDCLKGKMGQAPEGL